MDDVRRPCAHRGTAEVFKSNVTTKAGALEFCVCKTCERFWLERDGWLLSRRETASVLKTIPRAEKLAR